MRRLAAIAVLATALGGACDTGTLLPPQIDPRLEIELPRIVRHDLPSGITVLAARNTDGGLVHVELVMRAGYDFDPPGKEGLARLGAALLEAHTRAPRHDTRFGSIGATPQIAVDRAGLRIGIDVLQADAAEGARALAELVRDPMPVADMMELGRERCRAELARSFGVPEMLAAVAMARIFSPWKNRQSVLGFASDASLAAIEVADVERWLAQLPSTRDTAMVVTGPHDVGLAKTWAIAAFASWPAQEFRRGSGAAQVLPREQQKIFVPSSDMPQTLIVIGGLRPRPEAPDTAAFDAAYELLAGAIVRRLREELKLTYGAHRTLPAERDAFNLVLRVPAEKTGVALREIERSLEAMSGVRVDGWLATRRRYGATRLMDSGQSSEGLALHASRIFLDALPLDSLQRQVVALQQLDDLAFGAAVEQYLARSRVRIVVVGDPKRMKDQLDKFVEWTPEILLGS